MGVALLCLELAVGIASPLAIGENVLPKFGKLV
jgi:hypothetical protein